MYSSRMELVTRGPEETQALGRRLGELMEGGELVLMVGDLGAGKTCLTQGIAWGLGVNEYARSPTFVLVSEYEGRHTLFHADLYRVDDPLEMEDPGVGRDLWKWRRVRSRVGGEGRVAFSCR